MQCGGGRSATLPRYVYDHIAAGTQSSEMTVGPSRGKRGQDRYLSGLALQQHLGDTGGAAEVRVDLEPSPARVQQTLGRCVEKVLNMLIRVISIIESRPQVRVPTCG